MLLWSGDKCCTSTNAMPGSSEGSAEKKASMAASPPADAPMPTIGKSVALETPAAGSSSAVAGIASRSGPLCPSSLAGCAGGPLRADLRWRGGFLSFFGIGDLCREGGRGGYDGNHCTRRNATGVSAPRQGKSYYSPLLAADILEAFEVIHLHPVMLERD